MKKNKIQIALAIALIATSIGSQSFADEKGNTEDKGNLKIETKEDKKEEKIEKKEEKLEEKEIKKEIKDRTKEERDALKLIMKDLYTDDDMQKMNRIKIEIEKSGLKVIPVENILLPGKEVKFDTPPVIKDGRVLVPINSLVKAFGADVSWNQETREITIVKEGRTITLKLDSMTAIVDGKEVKLDVPAQSINSRTLVPVRFIIENMGLKVKWNPEDQTLEIEEETYM